MPAIEKNGKGWIDADTGNLIDRKRRCYEIIFSDGKAVRVKTMPEARHCAGLPSQAHALAWLDLGGKSAKRRSMTWKKFHALCFVNSRRIPKYVEIDGRRKEWVGIGVVDLGPADGSEVLVTA